METIGPADFVASALNGGVALTCMELDGSLGSMMLKGKRFSDLDILDLKLARSDFKATIPFNFERLKHHHYRSNKKSNPAENAFSSFHSPISLPLHDPLTNRAFLLFRPLLPFPPFPFLPLFLLNNICMTIDASFVFQDRLIWREWKQDIKCNFFLSWFSVLAPNWDILITVR